MTPRYEMEMSFSRGLYRGWLNGVNHRELVHARFGKKRGVFLGEVANLSRTAVRVKLEGPLKPGDGVVFDAGQPEEPEQGGRVYEVKRPKPGSAAKIWRKSLWQRRRGFFPRSRRRQIVEDR